MSENDAIKSQTESHFLWNETIAMLVNMWMNKLKKKFYHIFSLSIY